jgi:hypothetical protein
MCGLGKKMLFRGISLHSVASGDRMTRSRIRKSPQPGDVRADYDSGRVLLEQNRDPTRPLVCGEPRARPGLRRRQLAGGLRRGLPGTVRCQ